MASGQLERDIERRVKREFPAILALKIHVRHWPDTVFFLPGGKTVFIEFKRPGQKPRFGQNAYLERLEKHGFDVHVVDDVDQGIDILRHCLVCPAYLG